MFVLKSVGDHQNYIGNTSAADGLTKLLCLKLARNTQQTAARLNTENILNVYSCDRWLSLNFLHDVKRKIIV